MFDLLIVGGHVLDGTGSAAVRADVAVQGDRIAQVGDLAGRAAHHALNAAGHVVAPGFIDLHSHDDFNLPVNPLQAGKVLQGVTTDVVGNCGASPAPIVPERRELIMASQAMGSRLSRDWTTFAEYLSQYPPTGLNVAHLVGHGIIRMGVMGFDDRAPTRSELERMRGLVAEAMQAGAFGLSTGLVYPPACFAMTDEIVELAKVAARFAGSYHTHMRDEGDHVMDAIAEALEIGRRSGAPVQISHLKVANAPNWGRGREALALIDRARAEGLKVHADQYPYTAASTFLRSLLPQWCFVGGAQGMVERLRDPAARARIRAEVEPTFGAGSIRIAAWSDALVAHSPSHPELSGLSLAEVGERWDRQPVEALFDLLIEDGWSTLGIFFSMGEDDVRQIMRHPAVAIGSDGIYGGVPGRPDSSKPHPRYFGTFPRVLGRYARDEGVLTLPQAVHKMTGLAAAIMGIRDRGVIKPGHFADLAVFDPATVADTASFKEPHQTPIGIRAVIVNGVLAAQDGQMTGAAAGRVLRRSAP